MIEAPLKHLLYNTDKRDWWGTGWEKADCYSPTSILKANLRITHMLIVLIPRNTVCYYMKRLNVRFLIKDID